MLFKFSYRSDLIRLSRGTSDAGTQSCHTLNSFFIFFLETLFLSGTNGVSVCGVYISISDQIDCKLFVRLPRIVKICWELDTSFTYVTRNVLVISEKDLRMSFEFFFFFGFQRRKIFKSFKPVLASFLGCYVLFFILPKKILKP